MLAHWPIGMTYFTQLSNLFTAAVLLMQLLRPKARALPGLKFSATVSIFVTFLVYLSVLGPLTPGGLLAAYRQDHWASLCLHLLTPALTVYDFFRHDARYPFTLRHILLALAPPGAYFTLILLLSLLGLRWGPGGSMAGPYPFLNYTAPAGWFGIKPETAGFTTLGIGVIYAIAALLLVFYTAGWALWRLAARCRDKEAQA